MPNPYEVIHRETNTREENGIKYEDVRGYDSQGRLVLQATYIKYPDGKEGHFFRSVDENGYWDGGFYDPISDTHGQLAREPFEE